MDHVDFLNRRKIIIRPHYRYDKGVKLRLFNIPEEDENKIVCDFCKDHDSKTSNPQTPIGGVISIPDELFRDATVKIMIYVVVKGSSVNTIREIEIPIINRPRPQEFEGRG